ncbi:MAG TPA: DUF4157 domain-containing protein [Kofleriaceae bacterium]|nr:DUF4157 domain-containing protein [Kofleriaceae bacterium]
MRESAPRHEQGLAEGAREIHMEPSPELQRLARTVVSDQAQHGQADAGTLTTSIDLPFREEMEARFGQSFAQVRAHVDPAAAAAVGARAYTLGTDIVFATATPDRELVAHELMHVVQQMHGTSSDVASDEAQAETAAQGGDVAPAAQAAGGAPTRALRKDGILNAQQIKAAIDFNNSHWKDPHRAEILKTLRVEASAAEFVDTDVIKIASMQQTEGVDPKAVDGKLGPTSMAILLRKGLHLSEIAAKAEDVRLVFYPGEFENLKAWAEARDKAKADAAKPGGGGREAEFGHMYNYAPKDGHGTIYVYYKGNVVDAIQARGGPPFTMHDRGHTADPSQAGTYSLGKGASVVTKSWNTSQIAWGAPLREVDGYIQFKNPGQDWQWATGPKAKIDPIPDEYFREPDGSLSPTYKNNDFGETAFRVEGSPGLYVHTGPETEATLRQEQEEHKVHESMQLSHSHGCLHVDPYDRNRLMKSGYLQKGVTMVIKKYEDALDPGALNKK